MARMLLGSRAVPNGGGVRKAALLALATAIAILTAALLVPTPSLAAGGTGTAAVRILRTSKVCLAELKVARAQRREPQ
jgi:hypothetical protein